MPNPDHRGHPPATRRARLSRGAGPQAAPGSAGREAARRRAGSEDHSPAARSPARGLCQLDVAATGSEGRGVGDRRVRQLRDGAADSEKNGMTNRKIEYWVIPPEADGEFVAHMEEVLETYAKPHNPEVPVICMDEQPVQLLKETRQAIPATTAHAKRVDYEYERAGTANIFMFAEPLAGWREVR